MKTTLAQVIKVDNDKCKNCHSCIAACPVKICMDGSGDKIIINHDLCIGCGKCILACKHKARAIMDDSKEFFESLKNKEKFIAIVAPAVAAVFQDNFLKLNTYLKNMGIEAIFDVSFGAELTVKSYLEYIKAAKPKMVIAQPCPAIVSYIELYKPELLNYLAPADSPMLHTIKMIKEYYPEYKRYKIAAISPCPAKKREFKETGFDILNVTMVSLKEYIDKNKINLESLKEADYDNPSAERAVLFSTPGGLLQTAMREMPEIKNKTRKIEGPDIIYKYLSELSESLAEGKNPLLIDCLNCELGCNGGPATGNSEKSPDKVEYYVEKRSKKLIDLYGNNSKRRLSNLILKRKNLGKTISKFWEKGLYNRSYKNLSDNSSIKIPSDKEKKDIYKTMMKYSDEDIIDCCSCGYYSCEMMATAIHNGLNKAQNCNYYREKVIGHEREYLEKIYKELREKVADVNGRVDKIALSVEHFAGIIMRQVSHLGESSAAVTEMINIIKNMADKAGRRKVVVEQLGDKVHKGESDLKETIAAMNIVTEAVSGIHELTEIINSISENTNLLSMNAAIEAAHAGETGKGFAVVAGEIRKLAKNSSENSDKISSTLRQVGEHVKNSRIITEKSSDSMHHMMTDIKQVADIMTENMIQMEEMSTGSAQVTKSLAELQALTGNVKDESEKIMENIKEIKHSVNELAKISDDTMANLQNLTGTDNLQKI